MEDKEKLRAESALPPCTEFAYQDCEDFVGRGSELQRLLQILGASGGWKPVHKESNSV